MMVLERIEFSCGEKVEVEDGGFESLMGSG